MRNWWNFWVINVYKQLWENFRKIETPSWTDSYNEEIYKESNFSILSSGKNESNKLIKYSSWNRICCKETLRIHKTQIKIKKLIQR